MKNTLYKEIARLYQKGKTAPAQYECSIIAQTLMNLHLEYTYHLHNPLHDDIISDYKRYGRRWLPWVNPPIQGVWHLNVYFDSTGKLRRHNADEIIDVYITTITYMMYDHPWKKIAIEFNSAIYTDDVVTNSHSEMILFDPVLNTLEYVDSNNLPKHQSRKDKEYFTWFETRLDTVRRIAETLPSRPKLITNIHVYGGYEWGIQSLEAASDLLTEKEREGYCLMWSHLFAELALKFREYSIKQIVDAIMKKANSKTVTVKYVNDYMVYLIRGYVSDIVEMHGINFASQESMREGCCRIAAKITRR